MALWATLIVIVVAGIGGPLFFAWSLARHVERVERDVKYRYTFLLFFGIAYWLAFLWGTIEFMGKARRHELQGPELIGLAVVAALATQLFKSAAASRTKQ